jgi:hypothetical protein
LQTVAFNGSGSRQGIDATSKVSGTSYCVAAAMI